MRAPRTLFVAFTTLISISLLLGQLPDGRKTKESMTELSLKGSDLKLPPPLVGQIDQQPTFSREMIRLEWRLKDPVDLFVVVPKQVPALKPVSNESPVAAKKPPVILYIYNYTKTTDRFMHDKVCQYLSGGNVAAVGFPTAFSVTRFRNRPLTEWFVSYLQEALAESTHDVQMVISYLETRKDIDTSRIGVFGEGSGAAIAVLAAAADPRIKVLDLEDAWGDWPTWLAKSSLIPEAERPTYLKPDFLKNVAGLDPVTYLPKLKIPVRSQYSLEKSAVPPEVRKNVEAALPPQAAHMPVDLTFDWIKKQLQEMGN